MIRTEYSGSLFTRSYVCFFIFSHSTFDLPAMPLNWCKVNLIIVIHNSMITLTQCTMHGRRVLDVRCSTCPQCLETGVDQFNHLIYISKFTPTHRAMHGRRVFIFLVPPAPFLIFRIFSRGIVPPYRTTTGPTSEFRFPPALCS
jgi:hypothetical protein